MPLAMQSKMGRRVDGTVLTRKGVSRGRRRIFVAMPGSIMIKPVGKRGGIIVRAIHRHGIRVRMSRRRRRRKRRSHGRWRRELMKRRRATVDVESALGIESGCRRME